jgi:hypothetical protein
VFIVILYHVLLLLYAVILFTCTFSHHEMKLSSHGFAFYFHLLGEVRCWTHCSPSLGSASFLHWRTLGTKRLSTRQEAASLLCSGQGFCGPRTHLRKEQATPSTSSISPTPEISPWQLLNVELKWPFFSFQISQDYPKWEVLECTVLEQLKNAGAFLYSIH